MSETIEQLYNEGYCDKDISSKLNIPKHKISYWRRKAKLPSVFLNRKRLSSWEIQKIEKFVNPPWRTYANKTKKGYRRGLKKFILTLNKPLAKLNHLDVETYVKKHNDIDDSRINELLRTPFVRKYKIPDMAVSVLYRFANYILCTRIFYRDKGCKICKQITSLNLHHMRGKYDLREENLITLCKNCHLIIRHASIQHIFNPKYKIVNKI